MTTLIGHGYIANVIAERLKVERPKDRLYWYHHTDSQIILDNFIVNAAGFTGVPNIDECETKKEECMEANVLWPLNIEKRFTPTPIIHITSGCVYNGYKDGGWTEEDEPNFTGSFYSLCKAMFQMHSNLEYHYLLRVRMPFGAEPHPRNLLTKLRKYDTLVDSVNSLSCVDDIAKAVCAIIENHPEPGIYNVCNPGEISTREIAQVMGLKKKWVTQEEFSKMVVAPRSFTTLSTEKIRELMPIRDVREALMAVM